MIGFILKVLALSVLISIGIKQGGGYLPVTPTATTAWVAVLTPSLLLAGLLGWRWQKQQIKR
ncbi:hypothetical protein OsccyDRAFT_4119 [Leptolyngbyaceae cyanobacterium JSC-12]|nr:hypothetical protein OsccyDRAFT_4119 [Leptolyngbyaceae cyanobacterium JSC-12]